MPYMTDYLAEQFAPFERMPFCTLDATVLSQIAMIHAKDVVPLLPGDANQRGLHALLKPRTRGGCSRPNITRSCSPTCSIRQRPRVHCSA